jgi:hypothetical protein
MMVDLIVVFGTVYRPCYITHLGLISSRHPQRTRHLEITLLSFALHHDLRVPFIQFDKDGGGRVVVGEVIGTR